MTQNRTLSSKSLNIKVKDDKVTITFNAQNWDFIYGKLLIAIAIHAEDRDIPVADHIGHALKLKLRDISPSQESYDQFMNLCERLSTSKQLEQDLSDSVKPDIGEPK